MGQQDNKGLEEVLGRYLSEWTEELRAGREPELSEHARQDLTDNQISELLAMARFSKAMYFPTLSWEGQSETIKSHLVKRVAEMKQKQYEDGRSLVLSSSSFAECIHDARMHWRLDVEGLSKETGIPKQVLVDMESGKRSPIRIEPLEKMIGLLLRLSIAIPEMVDLIRTSAEKWMLDNFQASPTQLGRVSGELSPHERRRLIEASGAEEIDSAIQRERHRIRTYTGALQQQIERQAPKFE